jgi:predicted acetyltransferase
MVSFTNHCYVDADFSRNWDTACSHSGFIVSFVGCCPIFWTSKLQTTIVLSTMEVEYIALSNALRDVIPMVNLLKEMKEYGIEHEGNQPPIHCKVLEDNSGALTLATKHQWHPRTKHINSIQYHHF